MTRFATLLLVVAGSVLASTAVYGGKSPQSNAYTIDDVRDYNRAKALGTDFNCVNNCTRQGYQYALCQSKCSYPDPGVAQPPAFNGGVHGTDFQCVSRCTSSGYQYQLCMNRCSY
jgi:hypothetical protein